MSQKIRAILSSYFQMIVYYLGLYEEDMAQVVKQRKWACQDCILRSGNWCSKKKHASVINYNHKSLFKHKSTKVIVGCGCWLKAKVFYQEPKACPLNRWKKFNLK